MGDNYLMLTHLGDVHQWGKTLEQDPEEINDFQEGISGVWSPFLELKVKVNQIFCSKESCFALSMSMDLYSWGKNLFGKLGTGDLSHSELPQKVKFPKGDTYTYLSAVDVHSKGKLTFIINT